MDNAFILQDSIGGYWHIYLSDTHRINYTYIKDGKRTMTPTSIDGQLVKKFCATMDIHGRIHILAYTHTRYLIYYQWNGEEWRYNVIERIKSRFQNISYVTIISSRTYIHMLYYIQSSLYKNTEVMTHYYGDGQEWARGRIWTFTSDNLVMPMCRFVDLNDNLHILYRFQRRRETSLFYCKFDSKTNIWTTPSSVHSSMNSYRDTTIYVDSDNNIHIAWIEKGEDANIIKYLTSNNNDDPIKWPEGVLNKDNEKASRPAFFYNKTLYCFWQNGESILFKWSDNNGLNWSKSQSIMVEHPKNIEHFEYVSLLYDALPPHLEIWGTISPKLNIFPLGLMPQKLNAPPQTSNMAQEGTKWLEDLKKESSRLSRQIEEIYQALYAIQDKLIQNERSLYSLQSNVKRHDFEIKQLQDLPKAEVNESPNSDDEPK